MKIAVFVLSVLTLKSTKGITITQKEGQEHVTVVLVNDGVRLHFVQITVVLRLEHFENSKRNKENNFKTILKDVFPYISV